MNTPGRSTLLLVLPFFVSKLAFAEPLQARQFSDFNNYILALSWQTGYCHSLSERHSKEPSLCKNKQDPIDKRSFITVHGLWPSLPASVAARGVDEKRWKRYGCSTRPIPNMPVIKTSHKCSAPVTGISLEIASKLAGVMPDAGGESCFERYEYAKHGACFGFNPNDYFGTMVRLSNEVKQQALGKFIQQYYGRVVTRAAFDSAVEESWGKEAVKSVKLSCQGNPAYLTEIRLTIRADKINLPLHNGSFAAQKHPGNCGESFRLDAVSY